MNATLVMAGMGVIVLVGVLGTLLFERTKVPDILILMGLGLVLGPVLKWVDAAQLAPFADFVGLLALAIILFEGGLNLDFIQVIRKSGAALVLALTGFLLTTAAVAGVARLALGWDWITSLFLGTALGGTSGAVVITLASHLSARAETKTLLNLESVLTDIFSIVMALSLIELAQAPQADLTTAVRSLAQQFSIAIVAALGFGLGWVPLLYTIQLRSYAYMATLAVVLVLYGLVEMLTGSGPLATLIFGLILTNSERYTQFFGMKERTILSEPMKRFNAEIAFFVRTFFFIYVGAVFTIKTVDFLFVWLSVVLLVVQLAMRYLATTLTVLVFRSERPDRWTIAAMAPRGLTSTVLANMVAAFALGAVDRFSSLTVMQVFLTNLVTMAAVFFLERARFSVAPPLRSTSP